MSSSYSLSITQTSTLNLCFSTENQLLSVVCLAVNSFSNLSNCQSQNPLSHLSIISIHHQVPLTPPSRQIPNVTASQCLRHYHHHPSTPKKQSIRVGSRASQQLSSPTLIALPPQWPLDWSLVFSCMCPLQTVLVGFPVNFTQVRAIQEKGALIEKMPP